MTMMNFMTWRSVFRFDKDQEIHQERGEREERVCEWGRGDFCAVLTERGHWRP